uniref:Uncharacterized protein n=1 Tax=Arundo donax TaxID=35708 RepID=A0A0A8YD55_ARUDO
MCKRILFSKLPNTKPTLFPISISLQRAILWLGPRVTNFCKLLRSFSHVYEFKSTSQC